MRAVWKFWHKFFTIRVTKLTDPEFHMYSTSIKELQ